MSVHFSDPTWIFFVVLLIILLAPLLFERLHIPQIVGMILAGVLIGPHGLDILARDSSFELFGQVGLYYIMFLAGISMDTGAFKRNKIQVLSFSLMSFLIPFALGGLSAYYLLHLSVPASVMVSCVLSSHTLVSYSIVSRYALSRHQGVSLSVVATMVSLMLALFVLAGLAGSFHGHTGWRLWTQMILKCSCYVAALFFIYPRIIRFFFRTFSDDILQYIFVLALVFLSAATSQALGLEGVFGAFLAGLVLNRYIPETVPLMRHIDFVGNALFIPYFLIGVGMLINFNQIFSHPEGLIVVGVICVMAILTKWLAAWLASVIFQLGRDVCRMMTGLTSGHAAGALAMLMVGRELEVAPGQPLVDDTLMGAVVMLILVSCIFSAVVTTSASKRIAISSVSDEEKQGDEDRILVALANPRTTSNLVALALMMRPHRSTAPLVGVKLVVDAKDNERERDAAHQLVKEAAQLAASAGVNMKKVVRSGINLITALTYTMKDFDASELIIGYHQEVGRPSTSFDNVTIDLLSRISRQIIIVQCTRAVNTIRCIHVVVPQNAEYEAGFQRWLMHVSRLARQMDCRIIFYSTDRAWERIERFCNKHYKTIRMSHVTFNDFSRLTELSEEVHTDHLLVLIAARENSLSYQPAIRRIPELLADSFSQCSKMLVFPDQYGVERKMSSFNTGFPSGN